MQSGSIKGCCWEVSRRQDPPALQMSVYTHSPAPPPAPVKAATSALLLQASAAARPPSAAGLLTLLLLLPLLLLRELTPASSGAPARLLPLLPPLRLSSPMKIAWAARRLHATPAAHGRTLVRSVMQRQAEAAPRPCSHVIPQLVCYTVHAAVHRCTRPPGRCLSELLPCKGARQS
jgi:hypothetical protein